jgi:hypothetical protein
LRPVDPVDQPVGAVGGLLQAGPARGQRQNTAAAGEEPAILARGACVKHLVKAVLGGLVQPGDHAALLIRPRIAIRRHHHRQRVIFGPVDPGFVQPPLGRRMHQVERLTAQAHHQHLTFRIAEADVELDQPGLIVLDHQPDEEHPLIGRAAPHHFGQNRAHDLVERLLRDSIRHHRRGGIGPHAAGVGAGITLADALVILRGADGQGRLSVAENEERGFFSGHELLDHHLGPGRAEFAAEHVVECGKRLILGLGHDHALACGQTIGLDHDRRALRLHVIARRRVVGEMAIGGRGGTRRVADCLGETLGGLKSRRLGPRAKDQQTRLAQPVGDACGQRGLGADDHEINRLGLAKPGHGTPVENIQRGAIRDFGDPGIAGGHDQPVAFGVLQRGPCDAVFTATAAEDQDIHGA